MEEFINKIIKKLQDKQPDKGGLLYIQEYWKDDSTWGFYFKDIKAINGLSKYKITSYKDVSSEYYDSLEELWEEISRKSEEEKLIDRLEENEDIFGIFWDNGWENYHLSRLTNIDMDPLKYYNATEIPYDNFKEISNHKIKELLKT